MALLGYARLGSVLLITSICLLVSCTSSDADNGQTGSPGGSSGMGTSGMGGTTGKLCDGDTCDEALESALEAFLGPIEDPPSVTGSSCEWGPRQDELSPSGTSGWHCVCELSKGEPVDVSWQDAGCAYRGPHSYECLLRHGEIEPCDPDDASSCNSLCSELDDRIAADATRSTYFTILQTWCDDVTQNKEVPFHHCNGVVEIADVCYPASVADGVGWGRYESCELDPEQIVRMPNNRIPACYAIPETAPENVACRFECRDAGDCASAYGCVPNTEDDLICFHCRSNDDCLPSETCVVRACLPSDNAQCTSDDGCAVSELCAVVGVEEARDRRGNETVTARCVTESSSEGAAEQARRDR